MDNVIDFKTRRVIPINILQREWVESVATESIDNLDIADIMSLIQGMEEFDEKTDNNKP